MKLLEKIKSLLNLNNQSLAYAACVGNAVLNNNSEILRDNVVAFWQPSMGDGKNRGNEYHTVKSQKTTYDSNYENSSCAAEIIKKARKLARNLNKIAQESPKSLSYYLSKEDAKNLELLVAEMATAMTEIKKTQLLDTENHDDHDLI